MSKILKVENGNYTVKVESGSSIILDTSRGQYNNDRPIGSVVIRGGLIVEGETTTVESIDTYITDNIFTVNSPRDGDAVSAGISAIHDYKAGLEIDRGTEPKATFVFDEQISWNLGGTSGSGTFRFDRADVGLLPILVSGIKSNGTLYIDTGSNAMSVTNTVDYEENVFTYVAGTITDTGSGVVIDDDTIPNTKALVDYCNYVLISVGQTSNITSYDTSVTAIDFSASGNPSKVETKIDNTVKFTTYDAKSVFNQQLEINSVTIENNEIYTNTTDTNLTLSANGLGSVVINDILQITDTAVVPSTPVGSVNIYANNPSTGGTGIYFINKDSVNDELISKNRSLLYSMIF